MPYIRKEERTKFVVHINEILGIMREPTDTLYVKGEYFGHYVSRLIGRFTDNPSLTAHSFNSAHFVDSKRKTLDNSADSIAAGITKTDPIAGAGDLNYVISAVLWGCLGQAEGFASASYGMRAYLTGVLVKLRNSLNPAPSAGASQRDVTMGFRRNLVAIGVLTDVLNEVYRRDTSVYEDGKIDTNGDIWVDGQLVV